MDAAFLFYTKKTVFFFLKRLSVYNVCRNAVILRFRELFVKPYITRYESGTINVVLFVRPFIYLYIIALYDIFRSHVKFGATCTD